MAYSIHDAYTNEKAMQIIDSWKADRAAQIYNLTPIDNQGLDKDVLVKSYSFDGKDDGKISFDEKLKHFCKGMIKPFETMIESPANFLTTLAVAGIGTGLILATGGAAAPILTAIGLLGGGASVANGIYKQCNAKTDEAALQAWQDIGAGTVTLGLSAAGAKVSAKSANIDDAEKLGFLKSSFKCITSLPLCVSQAFSKIKSGFSNNSGTNSHITQNINSFSDITSKLKGFWDNFSSSAKSALVPTSASVTGISSLVSSGKNNLEHQNDFNFTQLSDDVI